MQAKNVFNCKILQFKNAQISLRKKSQSKNTDLKFNNRSIYLIPIKVYITHG